MDKKRCSKCGEHKDPSEFYNSSKGTCKSCQLAMNTAWKEKHKEQHEQYQREYHRQYRAVRKAKEQAKKQGISLTKEQEIVAIEKFKEQKEEKEQRTKAMQAAKAEHERQKAIRAIREKKKVEQRKPAGPPKLLPYVDPDEQFLKEQRKINEYYAGKKSVVYSESKQKVEGDQNFLSKFIAARPTREQVKEASDQINKDLRIFDGETLMHLSNMEFSVLEHNGKKYVSLHYVADSPTWEQFIKAQQMRAATMSTPRGAGLKREEE